MSAVILTTECVRVLRVLAKGGRIEARRTFPHPFNFSLVRPADVRRKEMAEKRYAGHLAEISIDTLVRHGLNQPVAAVTPFSDRIDYGITDAGTDALIDGGELRYDEGWAGDLFGEGGA